MHAVLIGNHIALDKKTDDFQKIMGKRNWDAVFSRRVRNSVFTYGGGQVYDLFFPLQRGAYQTIFVHESVDLFDTSSSLDFLARAANAVAPGGMLIIDSGMMVAKAGEGRPTQGMVEAVLGQPQEIRKRYWVYGYRERALAEDRSVLGWFYNQRGNIVEANVTGGAIVGKSPAAAKAVFGRLLYPGDELDTQPKRLPRNVIVDIVERVRSGALPKGSLAEVGPATEMQYSWDWESYGQKFRPYQESWENYLIPGNIYKAATIASILRANFPGRKDLSFLEHGGNAGVLTAQLLLDLPDMLARGVCCEVDIVPLLNALNVFNFYEDRLVGRMYVRNESAEAIAYDSSFSVIAFVHMLLYMRRDMLPDILGRAWDALEPGGLLLVFENTHPPTTLSGADADILFMQDELESYLTPFGQIHYALPGTALPPQPEQFSTTPLFRFIRKPQ